MRSVCEKYEVELVEIIVGYLAVDDAADLLRLVGPLKVEGVIGLEGWVCLVIDGYGVQDLADFVRQY